MHIYIISVASVNLLIREGTRRSIKVSIVRNIINDIKNRGLKGRFSEAVIKFNGGWKRENVYKLSVLRENKKIVDPGFLSDAVCTQNRKTQQDSQVLQLQDNHKWFLNNNGGQIRVAESINPRTL